ncbi:MAG: heparinase II/III family protein [Deltaproteobacteria bacterium]|nr:heparinase II/III family protein [Deltaproteobacteria bacterium]
MKNDSQGCSVTTEAGLSLDFRSSGKATVKLVPLLPDLCKFNLLSLVALNRSQETILVGLKIVHGSQGGPATIPDISFTGGRETLLPGIMSDLRFPAESFGKYGTPRGWEDVREIEIVFSREKTYQGKDGMEVSVSGLYGESKEGRSGPRLSSEGLAKVLARDIPGVTSFFSHDCCQDSYSVEVNSEKVCPPFCENDLALLLPPPHPYPVESAQEILDGFVMGQQIGNPICWDYNPLGCQEWSHFLHRHHFLRSLVRAVSETGEERYVIALDNILRGWITQNLVPIDSNGGAGPSWESLSTAWRLREWLWIVGIAWFRKSFRRETRQVMLSSIWEHARSLIDHQGHPNNWIIVESAALTLAGLCFPEFLEAEQWVETGLERLSRQLKEQFFRDGVHFEISPLYHSICLAAILEVKQAAEGRGRPLPDEFRRLIEKSIGYLAALYRPDFTWPALNDSAGATGDYRVLMQKVGKIFNRPDLTWIGCHGKSGNTPETISHVFPSAGIATMRSHHGRSANHLVFRAGPSGAAHVHGDVLSLDVAAFGLQRLVDPGITSYAPDILTEHYRSAAGHNTLLLDGKGPIRKAIFSRQEMESSGSYIAWTSTDGLEILTGVCTGPWQNKDPNSCVSRTIIFVKGEYWIVRDILVGAGIHELTACWQFFPGRVDVSWHNLALTSLDFRGPRFALVPLVDLKDLRFETFTGSMNPCSGWVSIEGVDYPAPSFAYTIKGTVPITMVWLLIPFWGRPGSNIEANRLDGTRGEIELEVVFPEGHTDSLSLMPPDLFSRGHSPEKHHGRINFSRIKMAGCGIPLPVTKDGSQSRPLVPENFPTG